VIKNFNVVFGGGWERAGILNSSATNKDDISDEALKQLIRHHPDGRNIVVFGLAVLPEYRKQGIAR
jgi:ribosomal protein S18 acetylase RimI-like enzyme